MSNWSAEADPVDVAEQLTPADAADRTGVVDPIEEIGEANPADVMEQAIEVGGDDGADRA